MSPPELPPLIGDLPPPVPAVPPAPVNRRRWAWHLILLLSYVLMIGALGLRHSGQKGPPMLPPNPAALLQVVAVELALFLVIFLVACRISGITVDQLRLRWHGGALPLVRGLAYSVALRILTLIAAVALVVLYLLLTGTDPKTFKPATPQVDVMVDPVAMVSNPVYFWLNLTLISFVLAGLREELWRSGVLAAMRTLWPKQFASVSGGIAAVAMIAVVFGLAHAAQGWAGVGATTLLGFGLGVLIVIHRSIWDAVIAHGFFDATTFALMAYLAAYHPEVLGGR